MYKLLLVKVSKETFTGLFTWLKLGIAGMLMNCAEMYVILYSTMFINITILILTKK